MGASTARERDYIAAIGAYYQGDGVAHPARVAAYEKAMAGVAEHNRADDEAAIFHALSILGVAYNSPPDKTYARQKEAAKILNRLLAVEQLSQEEAAGILGVAVGTVKSRTSRARAALRTVLAAHARDLGLAGKRP